MTRPCACRPSPGRVGNGRLWFLYNPAGQIRHRTLSNSNYAWNGQYGSGLPYGVNGLNQVTSVGGQSPTYDAKGNTTSDGASTYSYDVDNNLTGSSGGAAMKT